jgi:hypothetical protein
MRSRPTVPASVEARSREFAEPLKRRLRARGRDPLLAQQRARAREAPTALDIDVVITWVDDSDAAWRRERDEVLGHRQEPSPVRDAHTDSRFRSLDELRYVLRGIDRNMPWVRRVVLVTSGQAPPTWLDTDRLRVVVHRDFMAPDALPTFNSHAIESAMWRIDGLSEHFVYMNDDFLVVRPIRPNDLFSPEGRPRICLTAVPVPPGPVQPGDSAAVVGARNSRELLCSAGICTADRLLAHVPIPQRRSIHAQLGQRFPDHVSATEHSQVRSPRDVAPVFLHSWFALLTQQAEEVAMTHRYVELSSGQGPGQLRVAVRRRDVDYICPNLASDPLLPWPDLARVVQEGLEHILPGPSRFER